MAKSFIYKYLSDDDMKSISGKIKEVEKRTSGELVVSIKRKRPMMQKKKPISELAVAEFNRIGMCKTADSTGILLFILFEDREFYILADKGVNEKVDKNTWEEVKNNMQNYFVKGEYCKGIINSLEEMGNILAVHFPIKPGDVNEIADDVIVSE